MSKKDAPKQDAPSMTVSKRQKDQLAAAHKAVLEALTNVGGIDMQIAQLEGQRQQARQKAADASKTREDAVRAAAQALDLDIEKESWNYDFESGAFTKTG